MADEVNTPSVKSPKKKNPADMIPVQGLGNHVWKQAQPKPAPVVKEVKGFKTLGGGIRRDR